eukprot:gene10465-biopygen10473
MSANPRAAATCSAVLPSAAGKCTYAPASSSHSTAWYRPCRTARVSGVSPKTVRSSRQYTGHASRATNAPNAACKYSSKPSRAQCAMNSVRNTGHAPPSRINVLNLCRSLFFNAAQRARLASPFSTDASSRSNRPSLVARSTGVSPSSFSTSSCGSDSSARYMIVFSCTTGSLDVNKAWNGVSPEEFAWFALRSSEPTTSLMTSRSPESTAACTSVFRCASLVFGSAPALIRYRATAWWPSRTALNSGVSPLLFFRSSAAPWAASSFSVEASPTEAAKCAGVVPWWSVSFGSARCPSRVLTTASQPAVLA